LPTPDPERLARVVVGEPLAGVDVRGFELAGQWCWGTPAGLAEDRALLDLIRALPLAGTGWVAPGRAVTWWGKQLAADHQRVALLRADLKETEFSQLQVDLGASTRLVRHLDAQSLRRLAPLYTDHLKRGGRVLFFSPIDAPRQSLWLDQLPAGAGVPVLWQAKPQPLTPSLVHDLNLSFGVGKAVEVFAAQHAHERSSYLLARGRELAAKNLEVRRLRSSRSKPDRSAVKRLALVRPDVTEEMQPGMLIQFEANAGGFRSTELLTVLELGDDQVKVARPGDLQAWVSTHHYYQKYKVYTAQQLELERGDRIRITRNNGRDAVKSGLRRDRYFVVESVAPDGAAHLGGGVVLPPDAGHWEYGFCRDFADRPLKQGLVVCEAEDLPRLQSQGWLHPGLKIVVCAADRALAERAMDLVLYRRSASRRLPGTDEISRDLALAAVGYRPEVSEAPEVEIT
jgi:hypothetical protein